MFDVLQQTRVVSTCKSCLSAATTILNEYVPTFRFGVVAAARAVTISINPAENQDGYRLLPTLKEYGIGDRCELTDDHLADAARRSDEYFTLGNKHRFFNTLASVVSSIDATWSYEAGNLSHIDVVACVTRPTWTNGVPGHERRVMLKRCREHFLKTLQLLPADCWLLCDGRTALRAIEDAGGATNMAERLGSGLTVSIGTLTLHGRQYRYLGWNRPAHRLYESPTAVGLAAKRLMSGVGDQPQAESVAMPSLELLSPSTCITNGLSFKSQRALMKFLVGRLGYNENAVCREYCAAERRGIVVRKSDQHGLGCDRYAHRLYSDGIRKRWM